MNESVPESHKEEKMNRILKIQEIIPKIWGLFMQC